MDLKIIIKAVGHLALNLLIIAGLIAFVRGVVWLCERMTVPGWFWYYYAGTALIYVAFAAYARFIQDKNVSGFLFIIYAVMGPIVPFMIIWSMLPDVGIIGKINKCLEILAKSYDVGTDRREEEFIDVKELLKAK